MPTKLDGEDSIHFDIKDRKKLFYFCEVRLCGAAGEIRRLVIEGLTPVGPITYTGPLEGTLTSIMNLKKALSKHNVKLSLEAETKNEVIEELIDVLDVAGKLKDRKTALKAVLEREMKMSTGMQNGIAIPHGKSLAVDSLVVAIGLKPDGIDFQSIDGKPCQVFILTVSPANRTGPHIQFLAEISRLLDNESVRVELIQATSAESVIEILTRT